MTGGRRALFVVDGSLAGLLGAGLLLAPDPLVSLFGLTVGPGTSVLARLLGAAILSHGAVLILTRDHAAGVVGTALIRGHLVFDILGFGISAYAASAGLINGLGWGLSAVFLAAALSRLLLRQETHQLSGPTASDQ